jgi:hypothetical protein
MGRNTTNFGNTKYLYESMTYFILTQVNAYGTQSISRADVNADFLVQFMMRVDAANVYCSAVSFPTCGRGYSDGSEGSCLGYRSRCR